MLPFRQVWLLLRTLTIAKLRNFWRVFVSFYRSRRAGHSLHRGMPVKIGFEPTTYCNLRCPECPSGLRSFTRDTGMADLSLFRSAVDQLHRELVYLLLYFQGEPYLHPHFLEMVRYARDRNLYVATSTNGHYLTESKARETVESGLSEVIVSVDGATQATYEAYRKGGSLEKVTTGIARLVKARQEAGTLHPFIILQFLVVRPNEHEIEEIRALGRDLGVDKVALKTAQIYDFADGHELIPTQERYSRYRQGADGKYHLKNPLDNQCWKLWYGAELTWDGKVLPCCFDKDAQHEMGSLQARPFDEIWRSPAYQDFRNRLLRSRAEIEMCRNCSEGTKVWGN
jgi:radical SAM protein with 4Fe4S-binding SPASM domain